MNILLTSVGRRSYIVDYFKQALGRNGKIFASNSEYTLAMDDADGFFITPLIYSQEYIPALIHFCREQNISAIVSLFDMDLLVLSAHRKEFESIGTKIILAEETFINTCNDKWKTYEFFNELGIKTPRTFINKEDVLLALGKGEINYPMVVKPRWGCGSMGIFYAENEEELIFYTSLSQRIISGSYLKYESGLTHESQIIYQEKIVGQEYGLDILNDLKGNYIKTFAKYKIAMRAGETDIGKTVNSVPFESLSKQIALHSRHEGLLSLDCIKDDDGEIYALEMNCRISGHYPLSYLAGFNYPQLLVDWLEGKSLNESLLLFKEDLLIGKDLVPKLIGYRI